MKKSEELLGLSIISIEDGKEVGIVRDLIVNPGERAVECLVVDDGSRYREVRILPFSMVEGVGEYAVTIQSSDAISDMSEHPGVQKLLEQDVHVKGTKVATKRGRLIGAVHEYYVDEDNKGKIDACELVPAGADDRNTKIIKAEYVITFGKDILVVDENVEDSFAPQVPQAAPQPQKAAPQIISPTTPQVQTKEAEPDVQQEPEQAVTEEKKPEVSDAARLFEERQRQYLIGRKLNKRIAMDNGEVLCEEGDVVTAELIDKAKAAGKYTELSMNTRS